MKKPGYRILSVLLSMAVAVGIAASCGREEPEPATVVVTGVSIDRSTLELTEGDSVTLIATVSPDDATNRMVDWSSSDAGVATVDGSGRVTAVNPGKATVTVTTVDGSKTASCSVTVEAKIVPVTGVTLDKETAELAEGSSLTLVATVTPESATEKAVEWSTSSPEIASVENGKVTALAIGTAAVTVKTKDGGKTASCEITVIEKTIPVEGVTLDKNVLELTKGDKAKLTVTVTPDDASDKSVEWSSSNEKVVTVKDGKVTAVAAGTATVTVASKDGGKTATCEVTVKKKTYPVKGVSFTEAMITVVEGGSTTVSLKFNPTNATNKKVTYESSDKGVATVSSKGKVTGVKPGTATITVTTVDGGKTATCEVTVEKKPILADMVTLDRNSLSLTEGKEARLVATVSPDDAADKEVTWSSSDESVATVDNTGKVTATGPGTATITAETSNKKSAACEVSVKGRYTVKKGSTEITEGYNLTIDLGETVTLMPFDTGMNAEVHAVFGSNTISSGDLSVAGVDILNAGGSDGTAAYNGWKITGRRSGSTTVTMTYGNMTRRINVIVKEYTVYYGGSEVPSTFNYRMSYSSESVNFYLYCKTDRKEVALNSSNYSEFTVTTSNSGVATDFGNSFASGKYRSVIAKNEGTANLTFKYKGVVIKTVAMNTLHSYEVHYNGRKVASYVIFEWTSKDNNSIGFQLYDKVDKRYVTISDNGSPASQGSSFEIKSSNTSIASNSVSGNAGEKRVYAYDCGNVTLSFYYRGTQIDATPSTALNIFVKVLLSGTSDSYTPVTSLSTTVGEPVFLYFFNVIHDKPWIVSSSEGVTLSSTSPEHIWAKTNSTGTGLNLIVQNDQKGDAVISVKYDGGDYGIPFSSNITVSVK